MLQGQMSTVQLPPADKVKRTQLKMEWLSNPLVATILLIQKSWLLRMVGNE